ncbi:hypothetical protein AB0L62_27235 [Nocardia asteroides]|uniref:hypothetical protein n=1 Tax=Nocardia asteroides TaxID=1824 RepID=UPI00344668C7
MSDETDHQTPIIRVEATIPYAGDLKEGDFHRTDASWSLEDAVDAFLDELCAGERANFGNEILVEVAMTSRSFPSMYFAPQLLNRLASTGMSLRITTGPRTTV